MTLGEDMTDTSSTDPSSTPTTTRAPQTSMRDYDALGEQLDRRGIAIDAIKRQGRRLPRRRPLLGRRHRRHALCPLPRRRRAARHLRQDRGLRRHPPADAATPHRLAAYPVGQGRPEPAEAGGSALRPRLRRDELQHLLRRQGPEAVLQVRLAVAMPTPARASRRSSTISNASRSARPSARRR